MEVSPCEGSSSVAESAGLPFALLPVSAALGLAALDASPVVSAVGNYILPMVSESRPRPRGMEGALDKSILLHDCRPENHLLLQRPPPPHFSATAV